MVTENTWILFFKLFVVLLTIYLLLKLSLRVSQRVIRSAKRRNVFRIWLRRVKVVYKPVAVILLLISVVSINYIAHGLIILGIGIFGYSYIKNYLSGVLFKINPLTAEGARIKLKGVEGEIQKFLPLGIIVHTTDGEQFVQYSKIDKEGFLINRDIGGALRQSLYFDGNVDSGILLDALFDCPLVDYKQSPEIREIQNEDRYRVMLTLEKGVQTSQIIRFLERRQIQAKLI